MRWQQLLLAGGLVLGAGCSSDSSSLPPQDNQGRVTDPSTIAITSLNLSDGSYSSSSSSNTASSLGLIRVNGASGALLSGSDVLSEDGLGANDPDPGSLGAFNLMSRELTQGQWRALLATAPDEAAEPWDAAGTDYGADDDSLPAFGLSLDMVEAALESWNGRVGNTANVRLRLPTPAEWEHACRAGGTDTSARYFWDEDENPANYAVVRDHSSTDGVQAIASRQPNALGFYDMHGNLWEWVGRSDGSAHLRGGSWSDNLVSAQFGNRLEVASDIPFALAGIRLVAEATQNAE